MMQKRVDWGHGEKPPVLMYTEEDIRKVMEIHHPVPSADILCCCSRDEMFDEDHLMDKLKEYHHGRQAPLHPNTALGREGDSLPRWRAGLDP